MSKPTVPVTGVWVLLGYTMPYPYPYPRKNQDPMRWVGSTHDKLYCGLLSAQHSTHI